MTVRALLSATLLWGLVGTATASDFTGMCSGPAFAKNRVELKTQTGDTIVAIGSVHLSTPALRSQTRRWLERCLKSFDMVVLEAGFEAGQEDQQLLQRALQALSAQEREVLELAGAIAGTFASGPSGVEPIAIDDIFQQVATEKLKPLRFLESPGEQLKMFSSMSTDELKALASENRKALMDGSAVKELAALWTAWVAGNSQAFNAEISKACARSSAATRACEVTIDRRSELFAKRLRDMPLKGRKTLVVIGAGHLPSFARYWNTP